MTGHWREQDEALLARLDDERALARLWLEQAPPGTPPLPVSGAVLLQELRRREAGAAAVRRAADGDAGDVAALLAAPAIGSFAPALLHALGVYADRLGAARSAAAASPESVRLAIAANVRALAAWIALAARPEHVSALFGAGAALSPDRLVQRCVDGLAARAAAGSAALDRPGSIALAALDRAADACRIAEVDADAAKRWIAVADRARARVIDGALAAVSDALDGAESRGAAREEALAHFRQVRAVWDWSGADEAVERFAAERVTPIVWEQYRAGDWAGMRKLLEGVGPLVGALEARVLSAPDRHLAYAAKVAELLVFGSDSSTDAAQKWAFAERALRVCPAHRNARNTMAYLLCDRASGILADANMLTIRREIELAEQLVARAEHVFPASDRLEGTRAKIAAARVHWGVPKPKSADAAAHAGGDQGTR